MRHNTGATEFKPNQSRQPQNIITKTIKQATQIKHGLNNKALEQPPRHIRWGPNKPELSGSKDNYGQRKKSHIKLGKKKALAELAASICHTKLNQRGKDKF